MLHVYRIDYHNTLIIPYPLAVSLHIGKANSFKAFTINEGYLLDKEEDLPFDWVRRVDIGRYPRVACGSAHGSIFVADVNAKKILAEARGVHFSQHSDDHVNCLDEQLRQHIYGDYDGGGVLDVSMFGKRLVASAGREGGVKIFRSLENNRELKYEGDIQAFIRKMPGALPVIATCMKFDLAGRLYVGSSDGLLRIVTFPNSFIASDAALDPNEIQVAVIPMCERQQSPILALDISEDLGMVATAHASGDASVHSIIEQENGTWKTEVAGIWKAIAGSCARSISFVSWVRGSRHGVVVGGGNGELWVSDIDTEPTEKSLFVKDGAQKIEPNHQGPIISLVSRPGGIIASVSHDGQLRVTHAWLGRKGSRPLYGIVGLKVWVGSVCIDEEGKRLVSDGFDDVVVVHDFDPEDL